MHYSTGPVRHLLPVARVLEEAKHSRDAYCRAWVTPESTTRAERLEADVKRLEAMLAAGQDLIDAAEVAELTCNKPAWQA